MQRTFKIISGFALIISFFAAFNVTVDAQRRNDREVRDMLRILNSRFQDFSYAYQNRMQSNSADPDEMDRADAGVREFEQAVRAFEVNFDNRRDGRTDIDGIVSAALVLNDLVADQYQSPRIRDDWRKVTDQIDKLAALYGVTPNWYSQSSYDDGDGNGSPSYTNTSYDTDGLSGIYALDAGRSDNASEIARRLGVTGANRTDLIEKLRAQPQIAISINGSEVTLATTDSQATTFIADGSDISESAGGRTLRVRATLNGNELVISSVGGNTDHNVKFALVDGGRALQVTRRFTTDYLNETVFADSFYTKTDEVAALGVDIRNSGRDSVPYSSNDPNDVYSSNTGNTGNTGGTPVPTAGTQRTGEFIVPDGTIITGRLETDIDTKASQNNDRFRMTVISPSEYDGAVIEGYLSDIDRSGKVSGRSNVTFNFQRITMRDGRTYDFAGSLYGVKDQNGKTVKIDEEGTAKGGSQTKETIKRGGIGAGIGALIGAIAGGAKGAAIGAIIGGGAGAGSVVVMGRDDLRLLKGSEITIQSSSPIRPR
jgi:hypothetical protein